MKTAMASTRKTLATRAAAIRERRASAGVAASAWRFMRRRRRVTKKPTSSIIAEVTTQAGR
jgi:hypothetical protein